MHKKEKERGFEYPKKKKSFLNGVVCDFQQDRQKRYESKVHEIFEIFAKRRDGNNLNFSPRIRKGVVCLTIIYDRK